MTTFSGGGWILAEWLQESVHRGCGNILMREFGTGTGERKRETAGTLRNGTTHGDLFHYSEPPFRQWIRREEFQQEFRDLFSSALRWMHAVSSEVLFLVFQPVDSPAFFAFGPEVGAPKQERGFVCPE